MGSTDGKKLEAWYQLEEKRKVKDNKQGKAGLAYHLQEAKRTFLPAKKKKQAKAILHLIWSYTGRSDTFTSIYGKNKCHLKIEQIFNFTLKDSYMS